MAMPLAWMWSTSAKAVEADHVLAHMRLDGKRQRLADRWQIAQRAGGSVDEIPHPVDVEDEMVLAYGIECAPESADHVKIPPPQLQCL